MSQAQLAPHSWPKRAIEFVRDHRVLWGITLAGFVWRAITIVVIRPSCPMPTYVARQGFDSLNLDPQASCMTIGGDSLVHYLQGRFLAEGEGIVSPIFWLEFGEMTPGGAKPPIYSSFLGVLYALGITDPTWQRLLSALVGSLAIFILGYTAKKVVSPRAGIITAVLVAICPSLWINDGSLKNDGIVAPFVALVVLLAYEVWRNPRPRTAVAFGLAIGFAGLARSESLSLVAFIGIPLYLGLRRLSLAGRAKLWLLSVLMAVLVVYPWVVRNLVSFENPVLMSVGAGNVLLNGSCDQTYYGDDLGGLSFRCYEGAGVEALDEAFDPQDPDADESVVDARLMEVARPYVTEHLDRLPVVLAARVARIYHLYDPFGTVRYDIAFEDRGRWQSWSGLWFFYASLPFAAYGAVVLRRRQIPISPLLGPIAGVAFTAAVTFGITRFRGPVDLVLCMLAGVAVDALLSRRGAAGGGSPPEPRPPSDLHRSARGGVDEGEVTSPATPGDAPPGDPSDDASTGALSAARGRGSPPSAEVVVPVEPGSTEGRPEEGDSAPRPAAVGVAPIAEDHGADAAPIGAIRRRPPWLRSILLVAVGALVLRLLLVLVIHPTCEFDVDRWANGGVTYEDFDRLGKVDPSCFNVGGDALYLLLQGRLLAEGKGYASPPFYLLNGVVSPGAAKPPAFPTLIAGLHLVGFDSATSARVLAAVLGAGAVLVIGHVAGVLAGRRAAVVAAVIAALYPMLWINDWKMLNDGPMALMVALVLLAAYRFRERPAVASAAWLGAAVVGAAYMRSEAANLVVFLVVPLALGLTSLRWVDRLKLGGVVIGTFALLYLPWVVYNVQRFHQPNLAGGSLGSVMINASCDDAWYGESMGYLDFDCIDPLTRLRTAALADSSGEPNDESDAEVIFRERSLEYFEANARRFPIVAAARVGRLWDVYRPLQNVSYNINLEGRGSLDSWLGFVSYCVLAPTAVGGLFVLRRRRITVVPFLAIALSVTLTAVMSFGITRFRVPAEVGICILAAIAIDAALRRYVDPRRARTTVAVGVDPSSTSAPAMPTPWDDLRGWRPTLPDRRILFGAGASAALVLGILVWSAGAQPAPVVPESAPPPTVPGAPVDACGVAATFQLGDLDMYGRLTPATVGRVIDGYRRLAELAPPDVARSATTAAELLEQAQATGFVQGRLLDAFDRTDRDTLVRSALAVIEFNDACP